MHRSDTKWGVVFLAVTIVAVACGEPPPEEATGDASTPGDGGSDTGLGDAAPPTTEACNGLDDDRDGLVDEGCPCMAGETQPCFDGDPSLAGIGACTFGSQVCEGESEFPSWGLCAGAGAPSSERVGNGIDDDCDGSSATCGADLAGDGWVGALGRDARTWIHQVEADLEGNVYVLATFRGVVEIAGEVIDSGMSWGSLLVSYGSEGAIRWHRTVPTSPYESWGYWGMQALTIDGSGNVFVAGTFSGSVNIGDGELTANEEHDTYLASFSSDGVLRWSRYLAERGVDAVGGGVSARIGLSADESGSVYAATTLRGQADFGGGRIDRGTELSASYVAAFDGRGNHVWSRYLAAQPSYRYWYGAGITVAADARRNVYVSGTFTGSEDFGGGTLAAGPRAGFLASYDATGEHRWSRVLMVSGPDELAHFAHLSVDAAGNVFLSGSLRGAIDFGEEAITGGLDVYLAQFTSEGEYRWVVQRPLTNFMLPFGFWGHGYAQQSAVGPGGESYLIAQSSTERPSVVSFDADGNERWDRPITESHAYPGALAVGCGQLYVTGAFYGDDVSVLGQALGSAHDWTGFVGRITEE